MVIFHFNLYIFLLIFYFCMVNFDLADFLDNPIPVHEIVIGNPIFGQESIEIISKGDQSSNKKMKKTNLKISPINSAELPDFLLNSDNEDKNNNKCKYLLFS